MVQKKFLTNFRSNLYNKFQPDSVFVLSTGGMFASGLNASGRIQNIDVFGVLDEYRIQNDLINSNASVHKDLFNLLPELLPKFWNKTILELNPELTEIRSITELNNKNIKNFIETNNLNHLQSWIKYYENTE